MRKRDRALVVAGEVSGDMHAAHLIRELRNLRPDMSFFGIGGERMKAAGVELVRSFEDLSVVGFTEVFSRLGTIRSAMSALCKEAVERRPTIALLVDYPGFNLRLAKLIRNLVPRMVYYIAPQVWAWGGWRARSISSLFDVLISVIPFECALYRGSRMRCHFVGHPVLDLVNPALRKEEFRAKYGLREGCLVGIVPGSRREEVERILPIMLECARILKREVGDISFAVSRAETIDGQLVSSLCARIFEQVRVVDGHPHDLMHASDLLMVASGTATLEAAILGTPMSIIYRTSPLTWLLAKGLVKVKSVGLANIIAGRRIVPEFIQYDANPRRISGELLSLLKDEGRMSLMKRDLMDVRKRLGSPGASKRAARLIAELPGP